MYTLQCSLSEHSSVFLSGSAKKYLVIMKIPAGYVTCCVMLFSVLSTLSTIELSKCYITPNYTTFIFRLARSFIKNLFILLFDPSFLPRQFTVRVGEWDLSDQDNYSEEHQVGQDVVVQSC